MSKARYAVLLTAGAEQDLESIYDYIATFDSPTNADYALDRLMKAVEGLTTFPERGSYPKELLALGVKEYRQTFFKPYWMIYRVLDGNFMDISTFENDGYFVTSPLFSESECYALETNLASVAISMAGSRSLLDAEWCVSLACTLKTNSSLTGFLPRDSVAVQCTFFEKSIDRNWLVSLHQDLSIPVFQKLNHPALSGWSEKKGTIFVQPPAEVLQNIVAVRLHIDECSPNDGPLKVVPRSHVHGRINQETAVSLRAANGEVICPVARGAAMLMRPLLLHSSSKASGQSKRRVLHFLFAQRALPFGLQWHHAV
jgi:plasmid stabilization system protein ParE